MTVSNRSALLGACLVLALSETVQLIAADLRTTLCDRPVCRTVAIIPDDVTPTPVPERIKHTNVQERVKPTPVRERVPPRVAAERVPGRVRPAAQISEPLTPDAVFDDYGDDFDYGGGGCGDSCSMCCMSRGIWADVDFLLGWRHSIRFPPLVTTSPNGTPVANAGVLPGATIVYPTEPIGEEARPGARLSIGAWLDRCHCWGIEGRYFMLDDETTTFSATSDGDPILARPFRDNQNGAQASRLLAFPNVVSPGSIAITTESEFLGGDALLHRGLCNWGCGRLDFLIGYQFARLDESLLISDMLTDVDPGNLILNGTTLAIQDLFSTTNEYHAATIGGVMRMQRNCMQYEIFGKVGLGNMHQTVSIAGATTTTVPGAAPVVNQFGLLAQGVNLGTFSQDKFCAAPEVTLKAIYSVNRCVDVSCGYTFLYFTTVAQPGRQVDVDLSVPTDRFRIRDSEFWMHALQCGVTMKF